MPEAVADSQEVLIADRVVIAFGFQLVPWFERFGIVADDRGRTQVGRGCAGDRLPHQSSHGKVFAGGDMVRGADLVVTAVYEGRQAAESIVRWLARSACSDVA